MELFECIKTRRSIRGFIDKAVDWDKVMDIIEAGRLAPSSGNVQNWKFVVVREKITRKKLAAACFDQDWMLDAPIFIVVMGEPEKAEMNYGARGSRLYTIQNCASAITQMLLAANSLGLGACWVGAFDEDKVRAAINLPNQVVPQAIIPVGYAAEKPNMPPKVRIEHMTYLEAWWGRRKIPMRGYYSQLWPKAAQGAKDTGKKLLEKLKKKGKKEEPKK